MASKLLVGIVTVVVVIAVVGAAYMALFMSNDKTVSGTEYGDLQLMIYGNANNDFTIDDEDLELIQAIIDGNVDEDWTVTYPFADANCDGVVDAEDVELIKQIIERQEGITIYVACQDSDGNSTSVGVTYPLNNVAIYGLNMINAALYVNTGSHIVAYASPSGIYETAHASLGGVNFYSSGIDWQTFMQVDYEIGIDALFMDSSYVSSFIDNEMFEMIAEIPIIIYSPSAPYDQISASATIGFLCGEDTEETGYQYAQLSLQIIDIIEERTSNISDEDKATFIGATMYIVLLNNSNASQDIGTLAGGIPYYMVNDEYRELYNSASVNPMNINKESLANFQDADVYMSVRTSDFVDDVNTTIIENFEYVYYNICNSLEFYNGVLDKFCFINNLLPAVVKSAYMAEMLYPDLFEGFGDEVAQMFIDAGFAPLEGQTIETLMGCITYEDYLNALEAAS